MTPKPKLALFPLQMDTVILIFALLMTSSLHHTIGVELHPPQKVCHGLNYRNTLFEARIFLDMFKLR